MKDIRVIVSDLYKEALKNLKTYSIFILFIALYLLFFYLFDPEGSNCLVKRTIHIPCPMCGMSRAHYYLLTLNFKEAWHFHPLVYLMPVIYMTLLFKGYGIFNKLFTSKLFWGVIIGLFIVTYIIRMYLYFPHTPPMDLHF